jgi:hypothetical protein
MLAAIINCNYMKILYIIIGAFISLSCTNSTQNKPSGITSQEGTSNSTTPEQSSDSSKWTDSFLELKEAITTGDRKAVKSFIDFPIKNKENEIWYLADSKLVMEISSKEIKPFTEADFDKYFSSIFALDLRKTLAKLNVEEFFKTNKSTSPEIEVVKDSKSKLEASYDKTTQKVTLTLLTTGQEFAEFAVAYEFDITPDQKIKFRQVHVAG